MIRQIWALLHLPPADVNVCRYSNCGGVLYAEKRQRFIDGAAMIPRLFGVFIFAAFVQLIPGRAAAAEKEPIRVGVLVGLTGDSAQFGKGELDGVTLAAEEWNKKGGIDGRRIELDVQDTRTSTMQTISAFKELVELRRHSAVIGPTWVDTFQAVVPLAERRGVLLLSPSGDPQSIKQTDPEDPMLLTIWHATQHEVQALLGALRAKGIKKVVATYTQEPYFQLWRRMIEELAPAYGLTIVASEDFDFGRADFKSFMMRVKKHSPDCLLLMQTEEGSVRAFIKERNQLLPGTCIAGCHDFDGFLRQPDIRQGAAPIIYSYFTIADKSFAGKFQNRFGYPPTLSHPNAYDAANLLFKALAAGKRTGREIRDFLLNDTFQTVTFGEARFNKDGSISNAAIAVREIAPGSASD